ncbi:hypothetical protein [Haloechinothrix salitolerans]|uniref:Histone acetyltransferase Rv0428c-like SH3 domain-containing protein n=1 Tax=Haloechinothrix salitolerans TaxID=926830 RepID=A0ABW2BYS0_9PSEU
MPDDQQPHPRAGFRLTVSVTPEDVGQRVSLRRRTDDGKFTDVVGILERWDNSVIAVRRRDDQLVEFDADVLVAGKVVPQAPPRRRPRM